MSKVGHGGWRAARKPPPFTAAPIVRRMEVRRVPCSDPSRPSRSPDSGRRSSARARRAPSPRPAPAAAPEPDLHAPVVRGLWAPGTARPPCPPLRPFGSGFPPLRERRRSVENPGKRQKNPFTGFSVIVLVAVPPRGLGAAVALRLKPVSSNIAVAVRVSVPDTPVSVTPWRSAPAPRWTAGNCRSPPCRLPRHPPIADSSRRSPPCSPAARP